MKSFLYLTFIVMTCVAQREGYGGGGYGYGRYEIGANNRNQRKDEHRPSGNHGGYSYSAYGGIGREYGGSIGGGIGDGRGVLLNGELGGYIPMPAGPIGGGIGGTSGGTGGSYNRVQGFGVRVPSDIGGGYGFNVFNGRDGGEFNRGIGGYNSAIGGGYLGGVDGVDHDGLIRGELPAGRGQSTTFGGTYGQSIGEVRRVSVGDSTSGATGSHRSSSAGGYGTGNSGR